MEERSIQIIIHHYFREKLHQSVIEVTRTGDAAAFKFYQALALLFTHQPHEALNLLTPLQADPNVNLGAILASIYIYKHFKIDSNEGGSISHLETTLRNERKRASDTSLYYAALFLHFNDRHEKAREYVDRMLSVNPGNPDGLILKGWVELRSGEKNKRKNPLEYFDSVLVVDRQLVTAQVGKVRGFTQAGNITEALTLVDQLMSTFPQNNEFAVEKLRVLLAAKDWDGVTEQIKKTNISGPLMVKVLEVQILATTCHDGSFVDATPLLKKLQGTLDKFEPDNGDLYIHAARLFTAVCGRHIPILNECLVLVERAVNGKSSKNAQHLIELARQQALQGRHKEALATLKTANQSGETSAEAMLLKAHCLMDDDQFDAAQQQLGIIEELHENAALYPDFLLAKAMLRRKSTSEALQLLKSAHQLQVKNASWLPYGVDYLIQLNPDFLLSVAEEYFQFHYPEDNPLTLVEVTGILESVVDACPGLLPALYRLANAKLMAGDYRTASSNLHHIIDHVDPTYVEAYLLMAQIGLDQNNLGQAAQYLEMGLSYNFQVRDHPRYHLLLARIQRQKKENEAALASIRSALILSGMRPSSAGTKRSKFQFSPREKAATYLELFHVMTAIGQNLEAGQVIQEAMHELKGTPQEGLVLLAQVDFLLSEDNIDGALFTLKSIPASHPQHLKAREKMADIYLHRLQDEASYLKCYQDIARQQPTVRNLSLLGDAHLAVHQVDLAVSSYEEALKIEPRNSHLASKIGGALILTHQYTKAMNYYKDALRDSTAHPSLRGEYASLLLRLGQLDKAEKIISEGLLASNAPVKDPERLMQEVHLLMLLAKLQEKGGNMANSISSLRKAQGIIGTLLKRVDPTDEQRKIATAIANQMASHALTERGTEDAIRLYREALSHSPDDVHCMAQLARVYLQSGDIEHCQYMCKSILKIDRENDHAQMMIAQIALRKNDLETATLHFRQALERQPCHYEMLGQFIDVCRRRGSISDALATLRAAEAGSIHGQNEPGLSYCQGLYDFYSGQHNNALLALNRARGHAVWGQYAIRIMLDICLNGDNEMFDNQVTDLESHYEVQDTELMALHTAAKLIQELQPIEDDTLQTHFLYPNFYLLATRQKNNVERALTELTHFAGQAHQLENPAVVFGLATAHLLLKQTQKAKNHLKRMIKSNWTLEEGEYLERCWLLLSDIYIQTGQNKLDTANELLRRVVNYNRSCAKAFEYLGYILEKEQTYREAASHFESAWNMTNQNSALVGYKLAYSYLKAKQYTDAIDVSQAVLTKYPDHPRIRKDVLDKAIANLRT